MRNKFLVIASLLVVFSMLFTACAPAAAPAAQPAAEATTEATTEATAAAEEPAAATEAAPAEAGEADPNALPRNETLYFNGQQWGSVVGWNPYSNSNNNAMAIAQQDNARVIMFETPYLYNMLDGKVYPLLADGDYAWNDDRTELTFKIKPAAKWNDGTPVTADDVA